MSGLTRQAAVVLLDIEGTIGSKTFLSQVLAPYAKQHLRAYVASHRHLPVVAQALRDTLELAGAPHADPVAILLQWIAQDRKAAPLKKLQGLVWQAGFEDAAFQGHLFADAIAALQAWHAQGRLLAVYSSGSVLAQHLYFEYSVAGDVRDWFLAHFDTDVGSKVEPDAYRRIAQRLHQLPVDVLFLSDSVAELQAAQSAGLQVLHVVREDTLADARFVTLSDFSALTLQSHV